MKRIIVPLDSKRKSDLNADLVGGKGAHLLKLNQQGFTIPPGFIITTHAFRRNLRKSFGQQDAASSTAGPALEENSEEQLSFLSIERTLAKHIEKHRKQITGPFAVRSSMVWEDRHHASFAGQLDTFLHVKAEDLLSAVKNCYGSLHSQKVRRYISARESIGNVKEINCSAMAVVVQQMITPVFSGVVFTADPNTGRCEAIIEATAGICEPLVSGTVTPDRYIVNTNGAIAGMSPVIKGQPLLSSALILQLAALANRIAGQAGCPQDIEWAWDGRSFFFLQSRPITSLTGKNIYSSRMTADMSPGLLKPLQWSTFTLAMTTQVFRPLFEEIIGPGRFDFTHSIRLIHSRLYANMTFFGELLHQLGLPVNFFEMITRDENERRRRPPLTLRFLYILVFRLIPFVWKYARVFEKMNEFQQKQNERLETYRTRNWTEYDIEEKHAHLHQLIQIHSDGQRSNLITGLNMSIRNTILKKMVRRHAPSIEPSDLLKGLHGLHGLEPCREIVRLSGLLSGFPNKTIMLCKAGNSKAVYEHLSTSEAGKRLKTEFESFLHTFGHISANTTNFTEKRWIENTDMIWSMIGESALNKEKPGVREFERFRIEKKNAVLKQLSFLQKPLFNRILDQTVTYLHLRERISLLLSEDTYQFRRLLLSLGTDLAQKGVIYEADDIFYLYFDELEDILDHFTDPAVMKKTVTERRARLKEDADIIPEDTICGEQDRPPQPKNVYSAEFISGICGSSGYKQGYAYVVNAPEEVSRTLTSDDILVVPFTHIGWTLLFCNIGGIIAETGGQLSHTSIIAREYGIPAVVNVPRAMQHIQTGQPLTVDANNGRVYLKHIDPLQGDEIWNGTS